MHPNDGEMLFSKSETPLHSSRAHPVRARPVTGPSPAFFSSLECFSTLEFFKEGTLAFSAVSCRHRTREDTHVLVCKILQGFLSDDTALLKPPSGEQ